MMSFSGSRGEPQQRQQQQQQRQVATQQVSSSPARHATGSSESVVGSRRNSSVPRAPPPPPPSSPSASPYRAEDLEGVLRGMRVTIAQYRDAVQASDEEKDQLVETIRILREQLTEARGEPPLNIRSRAESAATSSARRPSPGSSYAVQQQQQQQQQREQEHVTAPAASVSRNLDVSSHQSSVNINNTNTANDAGAAQSSKSGHEQHRQVLHHEGGGSNNKNVETPSYTRSSGPTLHPPLNERGSSPERLVKELAIAQEKQDSMARELQRVHHDYNAEIRRLQRSIARLEGQLVEVSEYAYASNELSQQQHHQHSSGNGSTPSLRPKSTDG